MLVIGCWLPDAGYRILDVGYWILDTGCWILDAGYSGYWMPQPNSQDPVAQSEI